LGHWRHEAMAPARKLALGGWGLKGVRLVFWDVFAIAMSFRPNIVPIVEETLETDVRGRVDGGALFHGVLARRR